MASASTLSFSRCRRSAWRFPFGRRFAFPPQRVGLRLELLERPGSLAGAQRRSVSFVDALRAANHRPRHEARPDPVQRAAAAYQNVPHLPHEYQAIAQVLPAIGATCVGAFRAVHFVRRIHGSRREATSMPLPSSAKSA